VLEAPLLLLAASLLIGLLLQHVKAIPENAYLALNGYCIYIALPSLVLIHVPRISLGVDVLFPVATGWIVFLTAIPVVMLVSRRYGWSRQTTGSLILAAGLGNTAFLGYPVTEVLYGAEGVQVAILVDQPGSFVATSTLGIVVAGIFSAAGQRKRDIFRSVLSFPPFLVFTGALILNLSGTQVTGAALEVLEQFAATLTPVALISIGLQLKFSGFTEQVRPLAFGLIYKMVAAPALILLLYALIFGREGLMLQVSVLQAAMPPMITASIIAGSYGLNARLAALMAGVGVPIAAVTLALWYLLLGGYG
jgi:malate permease and related proteins